jgi:transposase
MQVSIIGIDLAKNVFQVAALNQAGKVVLNRCVRRRRLLELVQGYEAPILAMEACATSHYWGRVFERLGYAVRLIPAQHVKAFTRINKTDAGDAVAICEAARRPQIHPVQIKSVSQQDLRCLSKRRDLLVRQRTALIHRLRGLAGEYGICLPTGRHALIPALRSALADADNELSVLARQHFDDQLQQILTLSATIDALKHQIKQWLQDHDRARPLMEIPGFGALVAGAFEASFGQCPAVLQRPPVRRLYRPGPQNPRHRRQEPQRRDHQTWRSRCSGQTDSWRARRARALRQTRRCAGPLGQTAHRAPWIQHRRGGHGQQDGPHCLGHRRQR